MAKRKKIPRKKTAKETINLCCGAFRCRRCGTPNYDQGSVCANCDEDPFSSEPTSKATREVKNGRNNG